MASIFTKAASHANANQRPGAFPANDGIEKSPCWLKQAGFQWQSKEDFGRMRLHMSPVVFHNTVLRDGHQSMAATRMTTAQMLPAAPDLDALGFGQLETWGGASIDACLRFLGEQPFDRVRALRKAAPKTPQSMLLRGQNIVQYTCFPDDVVETFVRASAAAGVGVFRIFDALNDIRNLTTAVAAVKACGQHARGEICYTTSPVHTTTAFVQYAHELKNLGCDSIGIKDMAGVITPRAAAELVAAVKRETKLPVVLHSHDTAGLAATAYCAAVEAGVDAIETSISPFANGTAQPDTLRMLVLLEGHPRAPHYDRKLLAKLRTYFTKVYEELAAFTSPKNEAVDSDTLIYQVPGGMLSNFRVQLRDLGMAHRTDEVLAEIPHVRAALGYPPLVTPISQIVGSQAMLNVKFGRWKNFSPSAMDIALGYYGKTPGPVDSEVLTLAEKISGKPVATGSPGASLAPRVHSLRAELAGKGLPTDEEAISLYAMFPREFEALLQPKAPPPPATTVAAPSPAGAASHHPGVPSVPPLIHRMRVRIDHQEAEYTVEEIPE
jgi:oxaloacetate decarboxylase alpha subunit/pyruvate carboxylase subunit B